MLWGEQPAAEIVGLAQREWMDLVVLAPHGHGALARALVGSTASAVARRAPHRQPAKPRRVVHRRARRL